MFFGPIFFSIDATDQGRTHQSPPPSPRSSDVRANSAAAAALTESSGASSDGLRQRHPQSPDSPTRPAIAIVVLTTQTATAAAAAGSAGGTSAGTATAAAGQLSAPVPVSSPAKTSAEQPQSPMPVSSPGGLSAVAAAADDHKDEPKAIDEEPTTWGFKNLACETDQLEPCPADILEEIQNVRDELLSTTSTSCCIGMGIISVIGIGRLNDMVLETMKQAQQALNLSVTVGSTGQNIQKYGEWCVKLQERYEALAKDLMDDYLALQYSPSKVTTLATVSLSSGKAERDAKAVAAENPAFRAAENIQKNMEAITALLREKLDTEKLKKKIRIDYPSQIVEQLSIVTRLIIADHDKIKFIPLPPAKKLTPAEGKLYREFEREKALIFVQNDASAFKAAMKQEIATLSAAHKKDLDNLSSAHKTELAAEAERQKLALATLQTEMAEKEKAALATLEAETNRKFDVLQAKLGTQMERHDSLAASADQRFAAAAASRTEVTAIASKAATTGAEIISRMDQLSKAHNSDLEGLSATHKTALAAEAERQKQAFAALKQEIAEKEKAALAALEAERKRQSDELSTKLTVQMQRHADLGKAVEERFAAAATAQHDSAAAFAKSFDTLKALLAQTKDQLKQETTQQIAALLRELESAQRKRDEILIAHAKAATGSAQASSGLNAEQSAELEQLTYNSKQMEIILLEMIRRERDRYELVQSQESASLTARDVAITASRALTSFMSRVEADQRALRRELSTDVQQLAGSIDLFAQRAQTAALNLQSDVHLVNRSLGDYSSPAAAAPLQLTAPTPLSSPSQAHGSPAGAATIRYFPDVAPVPTAYPPANANAAASPYRPYYLAPHTPPTGAAAKK